MGDVTQIAWTDHTFNIWWGCNRISPGCDNCYAAALDARMGGKNWETGATPRPLSEKNWRKPLAWNKQAQEEGRRHRTFCGSMMDWADKRGHPELRARLFELIHQTPFLDWQLLTKRVPNIKHFLPPDWNDGLAYPNVIMGCTVEDKAYGLKRMKQLVNDVRAMRKFVSIEPLLEDLGAVDFTGIDWIIVGGESGDVARPMKIEWAENIRLQAAEQGIPFFFKQMGARSPGGFNKGSHALQGVKYLNYPRPIPGQPDNLYEASITIAKKMQLSLFKRK